MIKHAIHLALLVALSVAGGACLSDDARSDRIAITPAKLSIAAGSAPVLFTATAPPSVGRIVWSLEGPGVLENQLDASVAFRPPATVPTATPAAVTATVASSAVRASADIEITPPYAGTLPDGGASPDGGAPDSVLRITPASAAIFAGGAPIEFRALISGVTWSLQGPGSLSFPSPLVALYAPPPDVALDTNAQLTAQLSAPGRTARAGILVRRPVGNLLVALGLPPGSGLRPRVTVTGPRGFARVVSASETLYGLAVGNYRVTAGTELVAGPIATAAYVPRIVGSPAVIVAGGTARVEVTYAIRRGSGHLWVASGSMTRLRAYSGAQLETSGTVSSSIQIEAGGGFGAALGADGDLWVAGDPFTLLKFAATHLENGGLPDLRLGTGSRGGVLDYLSGMAFDAAGNLWLASNPPPGSDQNRRILKFAASTLRVSDPNPTPEVTLRGTSFWYPVALAFDRAGNLWTADFINDRLVKFSPAQLLTDGAPVPTTVLSNVSPGYPLSSPIDLAIDADGNLWVANLSTDRPTDLVMYTATQAQAGGSPNPAIRIGRPSLPGVRGLAFDATGGLWMGIPGALARFSRAQLSGGGAPPPQIVIQDSTLSWPAFLVFNPPPAGVPLYR
jgi:hypothetical protein